MNPEPVPAGNSDLSSLHGRTIPEFQGVADLFRSQIDQFSGGSSFAVYRHGELVVDLWGGTRSPDGDPWRADDVAMCNSATKGVVATAVHLLVSRGLLDYESPVAEHWPEFAGNGKDRCTVLHVLRHGAGLHRMTHLVERTDQVLDYEHMVRALAQDKPAYEPGTDAGYHSLTFGWLVAEIIRRVSGKPVEAFVRDELVEPLGLDGLFIGCPPEERHRVAPLLMRRRPLRSTTLPRDIMGIVHDPRIMDVPVPAINGFCTARSLAGLYAMLAEGGRWKGAQILREGIVSQASTIQSRRRDRVLIRPMRWRLGYHRIFGAERTMPQTFGHYGFGGSGGWANPEHGISAAMICNHDSGNLERRFIRLTRAIAAVVKS